MCIRKKVFSNYLVTADIGVTTALSSQLLVERYSSFSDSTRDVLFNSITQSFGCST